MSINAKEKPRIHAITSGRKPYHLRSRDVRSGERFARLPSVIWTARGRLGLSLGQMAKVLGISGTRLRAWEEGTRLVRPKDVTRLASAIGVDLVAILLLRIAVRVDRVFHLGAASAEELHRKLVAVVEGEADLRPVSVP